MPYLIVFCLNLAHAQTPFEGWFRIEKNREHIGYALQRLSVDPKTHIKTLTTYARTKQGAADFYDITQATADANFHARHAVFTTTRDAVPHQITSDFQHGKVTARTATYPAQKPLDEKSEASQDVYGAFLLYAADFSRLKPKVEYNFRAYAEERARVAYGTLTMMERHAAENIPVLQLGLDYLGQYMESFTSNDGTPLGARNLAESTVVFWVATRRQATGDLPFAGAEVEKRFGSVPELSQGPWTAIKDAQLVMHSFAPPPRRLPGSPVQPLPNLPMRLK